MLFCKSFLKPLILSVLFSCAHIASAQSGDNNQTVDGGSTGGGGVVFYQSKAIRAILSSDDLLKAFKTTDHIKSIQHLGWKDGVTNYLILTGNGCTLNAKTVSNASGNEYSVTIGNMDCSTSFDEELFIDDN